MIEMNSTPKGEVVEVRFLGTVTDCEFVALAVEAARFAAPGAVLVLCDWLGIEHWEFSAPNEDGLAAWRRAARGIARVSIIHNHSLNRQSAWLAAILREEGVKVRSWRPQHAAMAASWLRESG
jgi:hypothetical protein